MFAFAIISSRMHMVWVRTVAGRLKTDYRYSSSICYNTFPVPMISTSEKNDIEDHGFNILDEREKYPDKNMADLYDPDKMPEGLRKAHDKLNMTIEKCYRVKPFENDVDRLKYLFNLYEEMIEAETKA